jgi:hypothetical protein
MCGQAGYSRLTALRLLKVNGPMGTEVILIEWPSLRQLIPVTSRTSNGPSLVASCRTGAPRRRSRAPVYQRRWKAERLFAWFQNFRRIVVRYERLAKNFLGMLHLASCLILLRGL